MRRAAILMLGLLVAGCGGEAPQGPAPPGRSPADDRLRREFRIPQRVPLRATGPAAPADAAVVRGWMAELSDGRITEAAARFALPATFANLDSATVLRSPADALRITDSLPCGVDVTEVRASAGYVVYEARLTQRPGGDCGSGVGGRVSGAILVRDGRIHEWWRLPDPEAPPAGPVV